MDAAAASSPERPEGPQIDPASFRDARSRVFHSGGRVFRALTRTGLADWEALADTPLLAELEEEGKIVRTSRCAGPMPLPGELAAETVAVLEHERVPFVSYPYEWTFGMLKDAALLHLELLRRAIGVGLMLKDASPYNVQWHGTAPVFIDVGSFEPLDEHEPWLAYRQFCMLFLYPLLLRAYKGVPFQPWLRGSLEGISPAECRSVMSGRDLLRRGVLTHVHLHSKLERRYADAGGRVRNELRAAGFSKEIVLANLRKLERLVDGLRYRTRGSAWTGYGADRADRDDDARRKLEIVESTLRGNRLALVWDLGCNDGRYARLAAEAAQTVVAIDAEEDVVEGLYASLRAEGSRSILPLLANLADPSPALGWRSEERQRLEARGRPDAILCLALVHHLAIASNIPLAGILNWLRSLGGLVLIEFPHSDDPMVQRLLGTRRPADFEGYDLRTFDGLLRERFDVASGELLPSGTRTIYVARPKG